MLPAGSDKRHVLRSAKLFVPPVCTVLRLRRVFADEVDRLDRRRHVQKPIDAFADVDHVGREIVEDERQKSSWKQALQSLTLGDVVGEMAAEERHLAEHLIVVTVCDRRVETELCVALQRTRQRDGTRVANCVDDAQVRKPYQQRRHIAHRRSRRLEDPQLSRAAGGIEQSSTLGVDLRARPSQTHLVADVRTVLSPVVDGCVPEVSPTGRQPGRVRLAAEAFIAKERIDVATARVSQLVGVEAVDVRTADEEVVRVDLPEVVHQRRRWQAVCVAVEETPHEVCHRDQFLLRYYSVQRKLLTTLNLSFYCLIVRLPARHMATHTGYCYTV